MHFEKQPNRLLSWSPQNCETYFSLNMDKSFQNQLHNIDPFATSKSTINPFIYWDKIKICHFALQRPCAMPCYEILQRNRWCTPWAIIYSKDLSNFMNEKIRSIFIFDKHGVSVVKRITYLRFFYLYSGKLWEIHLMITVPLRQRKQFSQRRVKINMLDTMLERQMNVRQKWTNIILTNVCWKSDRTVN